MSSKPVPDRPKGAWSAGRPAIVPQKSNVPQKANALTEVPSSGSIPSPSTGPQAPQVPAPTNAPLPVQNAQYANRPQNAWAQRDGIGSGVDAVVKGITKTAGRGIAINQAGSSSGVQGSSSGDLGRGRGAVPPGNAAINAANRKPDFNAGRGRGKDSPVSGPRAPTTFAEELYTTKVPQNLSEEKRREAERIAAEIEEESKQKQLRGGRGDHHGPPPSNGAYGRGGG